MIEARTRKRLTSFEEWEAFLTARFGAPKKRGRDRRYRDSCPGCGGTITIFPNSRALDGISAICYGNKCEGLRALLNP